MKGLKKIQAIFRLPLDRNIPGWVLLVQDHKVVLETLKLSKFKSSGNQSLYTLHAIGQSPFLVFESNFDHQRSFLHLLAI